MPPTLHVWTPGVLDFKGGIQVYSGFLLGALQQWLPEIHCEAFLMHDRPPANAHIQFENGQLFYASDGDQPDGTNFQVHYAGNVLPHLRTTFFASQILNAGLWHRPDLVLTTHLNFMMAAYQLKRLTGIPYWAVAHGFEAWNIRRPGLKTALENADRILAVSHYTRDRLLQEQNLDPAKVQLLPNTFDAQRFQVTGKPDHLLRRYGLTADQPVILTVNRLAAGESFHSYDQILAALPQIRQVIPNVHYLIVGKGDDRPRLEQLIVQQHLQDCVTLAGFVADSELPDYYNLCDVFAMPSKLEGFGIVYLEALASGKPVVGGHDGAIDALQNGALGALVNPDDWEAIAHTLIQILQGTYPNSLIYQPDALRDSVIQTFGFDRFQHTLGQLLHDSPLSFPTPRNSPLPIPGGWPLSHVRS